MVVGKGPRPDEAHFARDYGPELWQLVDTEAAEQASDARNQARVAAQLVARPPFVAQRRIRVRYSSSRSSAWRRIVRIWDLDPPARQPGSTLVEKAGPPSISRTSSAAIRITGVKRATRHLR